MTDVLIDCETIPQQGNARQEFIDKCAADFRAPSTMSKTRALEELGIDPKSDQGKYMAKPDAIKAWEDHFSKTDMVEKLGDELWKKTSFDGWLGSIVSIAWQTKGYEPQVVYREDYTVEDSESDMLKRFVSQLKPQLNGQQAFWIGHNCGSFDLPFLFKRLVINGINPGFRVPVSARQGNEMYDTMQGAMGFGKTISQKDLCESLGFAGKPGSGIDGSQVWDYVERGDVKAVADYNLFDIATVKRMYNRLTWSDFDGTFNGVEIGATT